MGRKGAVRGGIVRCRSGVNGTAKVYFVEEKAACHATMGPHGGDGEEGAGVCIWGDGEKEGGGARGEMQQQQQQRQLSLPVPPFVLP
ncbi:hypothetical protein ALC56_12243 [Trachymyrmex septentrionalis]|uniref:Uncharacterized protein n=1 Tax=Trachymyrmex septentrionalis TaxID=34720 RepID=A0A195EZH6_9HYME|nr:hypothetical protein ALC56_12243 [Trachymyrmex septentrionalis]